jgi:hypothetical protein
MLQIGSWFDPSDSFSDLKLMKKRGWIKPAPGVQPRCLPCVNLPTGDFEVGVSYCADVPAGVELAVWAWPLTSSM